MSENKENINKEEQYSLSDDRRVKTLSPGALTAKRFFRNRLAVLGLVLYIIGRIRNRGSEEKNPVVPAKVSKYLRDTRGEFKKIVWPNFPTVVRNTGVVLAMCAITAVVIVAVDFLSGLLTDLLLKL